MNFKQLRENQGLTMKEIAQMLGVSENYLWMIESGKRKMSRLLSEKFNNIVESYTTGRNNVIEHPVEKPPTQLAEADVCAVCGQKHCNAIRPDEVDIYQPRNIANTVLDNNNKLTEICNSMAILRDSAIALAKLDEIVHNRVASVMSTRSRAIITVYNHHIEAQARVMINDLESLIKLLKSGAITLDGAIMMLEDHKQHLADLRGYDPTDPKHNPDGGTPWDPHH